MQHVDWERFTVWVEEISVKGDVKWPSGAVTQSFEICQAKREVLLGAAPDVELSKLCCSTLCHPGYCVFRCAVGDGRRSTHKAID